jgi:hypothetical protein
MDRIAGDGLGGRAVEANLGQPFTLAAETVTARHTSSKAVRKSPIRLISSSLPE